ncbi:rab-GTPase-TBC domain-containing protein, partial [Pilobolus umbonatus]
FEIEYWSTVISHYDQLSQSELKELEVHIQHGIPSALRGTLWPLLAKRLEIDLEDHYIELLRQDSIYEKAIIRDLHRTFPNHPYFQSKEGQDSLFNVVKAYSLYDPEVGYCQGLSFIAGPLLLNMPEEGAFCLLVQLMHRYQLRGHFNTQLGLLRQRLYQLDGLILEHMPHIHRHFDELEITSDMYATQWFLTLFAYRLPLNIVYHLFDLFFVEGVDCLFRIGLVLLSKNQSTILSLDFDSLVTYLKDDIFIPYNDDITDLLCEASNIKISSNLLDRLAKEYEIQTIKEDTEAGLMRSLKKKNRALVEELKNKEAGNHIIRTEYNIITEELKMTQVQLAHMEDKHEGLKHQVNELCSVVKMIPSQIEEQMQSDMDDLYVENQSLTEKNSLLQGHLTDLESLIIEMKMKYAESETDRELLSRKLKGLKKWIDNV